MSKQNIERIHKIVKRIRARGVATKDELMAELEVSPATLKRDFDILRDRLGCPLVWDKHKGGYVIEDGQLFGGGIFELPGVWFDASEVYALLSVIHLLDGVQPGLLEEHIGPLKKRLRDMLGQGNHTAMSIEQRVKIVHLATRKLDGTRFQTLATAVLERKRLIIEYWSRAKLEATEREISPVQLVHYRDNWFLDAWCHSRDALRIFSLESIKAASILDVPAVDVDESVVTDHFKGGYGIFAGAPLHRAKLKFSAQRAQWVAQETWHEQQSGSWLDDGSYLLEVPYSSDHELVMDVLRHGEHVEVLDPPELRQKICEILCAAAQKYGDCLR
ncbi:DeoR family regulatory protein [Caballeronia sordidicola]|uniref:DeoR family regulatory protein n=1 Tax=Caballeronia sordidicola TaxID=196367 RepID=A0A158EQ27_CABSO|nr:WYL domain-containing protein [Caballeronia sordidicola]SAL09189.1 DeoR family regulatory protein [Caballeronia sordidicola]